MLRKVKKFIVLLLVFSQLFLISSCINQESEPIDSSQENLISEVNKNPSRRLFDNEQNLIFLALPRNITNDNYYIYFTSVDDRGTAINKYNIASGKIQTIVTASNTWLPVHLNVVEKFIYLIDALDDLRIHRIDINSGERELVSDIKVEYLFVSSYTIYARGFESGNLYAMNLDGSIVRIMSDD